MEYSQLAEYADTKLRARVRDHIVQDVQVIEKVLSSFRTMKNSLLPVARLPSELLLHIALSLLPDYALQTEVPDSYDHPKPASLYVYTHDHRQYLKESRRSLHALSLVAKLWHGPAQEALYTCIFVNYWPHVATSLNRTLTDNPTLARHIRRLVIYISWAGCTLDPEYASLIRLTSRLSVLTLDLVPDPFGTELSEWLYSIAEAITSGCSLSLRCVQMFGNWAATDTAICQFLHHTPQLHTFVFKGNPIKSVPNDTPRLPSLQHLSFFYVENGFSRPASDIWPEATPAFPSLTHICIDLEKWMGGQRSQYTTLLQKQSSIATMVTLFHPTQPPKDAVLLEDYTAVWAAISPVKRIQNIIMPMWDENIDCSSYFPLSHPPKATHLGFHLHALGPSWEETAANDCSAVRYLAGFLSSYSYNGIVHFTNPNHVERLCLAASEHASGSRLSSSAGSLRVVDHLGNPLPIIFDVSRPLSLKRKRTESDSGSDADSDSDV
ncbi:hypothetical protein K488DRAFT_84768 [Vararia minispora EC-137]|uniref:Uncharacterized protein n=1 Tax=Vararia minispora EC-137 TaxID=1314806 RepID=A0ACB8QPU6_9AGAM|nr:hypothetical protein K488DRAFT_84768 [Vararia minispora EC-137]